MIRYVPGLQPFIPPPRRLGRWVPLAVVGALVAAAQGRAEAAVVPSGQGAVTAAATGRAAASARLTNASIEAVTVQRARPIVQPRLLPRLQIRRGWLGALFSGGNVAGSATGRAIAQARPAGLGAITAAGAGRARAQAQMSDGSVMAVVALHIRVFPTPRIILPPPRPRGWIVYATLAQGNITATSVSRSIASCDTITENAIGAQGPPVRYFFEEPFFRAPPRPVGWLRAVPPPETYTAIGRSQASALVDAAVPAAAVGRAIAAAQVSGIRLLSAAAVGRSIAIALSESLGGGAYAAVGRSQASCILTGVGALTASGVGRSLAAIQPSGAAAMTGAAVSRSLAFVSGSPTILPAAAIGRSSAVASLEGIGALVGVATARSLAVSGIDAPMAFTATAVGRSSGVGKFQDRPDLILGGLVTLTVPGASDADIVGGSGP